MEAIQYLFYTNWLLLKIFYVHFAAGKLQVSQDIWYWTAINQQSTVPLTKT